MCEATILSVDRTFAVDSQGRFDAHGLHTDRYALAFSRSGYITEYYDNQLVEAGTTFIDVTAGETTSGIDAALQLVPVGPVPDPGSLSGTVTDADGNPINGVNVTSHCPAVGLPSQAIGRVPFHERIRRLDDRRSDTWYLLRPVRVGPSSGRVVRRPDRAGSADADRGGRRRAVVGIDAVLANGGTIMGTATTIDGAALAGIDVRINGTQSARATTGTDGTYRVDGLEPGQYEVEFFDPEERFFSEGFDGYRFFLLGSGEIVSADVVFDEPTARVTGRVLDAAGNPVTSARVRLMRTATTSARSVYTDADGAYAFSERAARCLFPQG